MHLFNILYVKYQMKKEIYLISWTHKKLFNTYDIKEAEDLYQDIIRRFRIILLRVYECAEFRVKLMFCFNLLGLDISFSFYSLVNGLL